ncbi:ABC transporter permease [Methanobrevibacter sp.]|uniref:ABC transporter permease n=1 Tax=Methanobrevibacter sp. TaxID=66852 RepID=UPI0025DB99C1|nr:ABC transporter permease [Methanobrevibacter sp.]
MNFINKQDLFLLTEIIKKNFSSKYKDSVLGIFWTILSPLLMLMLFTIIFSTIFGRNIGNYPIYFLCGWCTFHFFTSAVGISMTSLKSNKNILQRTPTPKYIFVLGAIISELLNFIIMLMILGIVMVVTHSPFYLPTIFFSIFPIICLFIMLLGLGLMLSIACVYYSDIQHLWTVVSMMLMYASAIFYPMDIIPEPYHQYFILNPLFWVIDQFRCFVYYGNPPQLVYMINLFLLSLIILTIGIIVFKKYEKIITMKF